MRWNLFRIPVAVAGALLCATLGLAGQGASGGPRPAAAPRDPGPSAPVPVGTATIAGTVVSADGGRPVRRATVRLIRAGAAQAARLPIPGPGYALALPAGDPSVERAADAPTVQVTDDAGAFRFADLPAGEYTISVSKPGYLTASYGQRRPGSATPGTPVAVAAGQRIQELTVAIPRGSVLTGTIVDDAGEPAYGVPVRALRYVVRGGVRVLEQAGLAMSDDRGTYRIPILSPGQYVVAATPRADSAASGAMNSAVGFRAVEAARVGVGLVDDIVVNAPALEERSSDGPAFGYAPVYYPGTTLASGAATVELGLSEERGGLDLRLALVPLGRIAGLVVAPAGRSFAGMQVFLEDTQGLPGIGSRSTAVGRDGSFAFNNVVPGTYRVTARTGPRVHVSLDHANDGSPAVRVTRSFAVRADTPGDVEAAAEDHSALWARAEATVVDASSPVSVMLTLQPALTIRGRIEFAAGSATPPADLSRARIALTAIGPGPGESAFGEFSGREFVIRGIVPGTYSPMVMGLPGWVPRSLEIGGRDILDHPLDMAGEDLTGAVLTMVEGMGGISGTIQDAAGQPTASYTVIVAPEDSRYWTPRSRRIQAARPSTDGRFTFRDLPAGDYRLVALTDVEPDAWFDPEFLRQVVPAAVPVSVAERGTTTQNVRVSR